MKTRLLAGALILAVAAMGFGAGQGEATAAEEGPVSLTIFKTGSGDMPPKDQDVMRKELLERLNIEVNLVAIATGDYDQQLKIRIAGGNAPDIFQQGDKQALQTVVDQGVALPLDDYIPEMPNIQESYTELDFSKGTVDGTLYAIAARPFARYRSFWIRQDWLDNLNLEHPTNLEEFREVANAFTYEDPDGNGKDDTYALTGTTNGYFFDALFGAFGTVRTIEEGQWMIQGGMPLYSTADPRLKDAIGYIKTLIDDGVVDPELVANTTSSYWDKVYSGKSGIVYDNMWRIIKKTFQETWQSINPDAEWVQVESPEGPGGRYDTGYDEASTSGLYVFADHLAEEQRKLDAALELFDYVTAGEGHKLVLFGVEGVHHEMEGDQLKMLDKISELNYTWNYQFTGRDEMWYLRMKFPQSPPYLEFVFNLPYIPVYNSIVTLPEGVNPADMHRFEQEQIIGFMYGNRPLSEWNDFVQRLYSDYDLQKYVDQAEMDLRAAGYID
jgi:putative aldouronate transport system substrate-binding protein